MKTIATLCTGGGLFESGTGLAHQWDVMRTTSHCLARFQSIPDGYLLPDKPGLACAVIGNAVPPRMAEVLVKANL